jgi:hypothetical protein
MRRGPGYTSKERISLLVDCTAVAIKEKSQGGKYCMGLLRVPTLKLV